MGHFIQIFSMMWSHLSLQIFFMMRSHFSLLKNLIIYFYTRKFCSKLYIWGTTQQLICLEVWKKYHMRYFSHGVQCKIPPGCIHLHSKWNPSKPITHEKCMKCFAQALGRCEWLMIKELKHIRSLKFSLSSWSCTYVQLEEHNILPRVSGASGYRW